MITSVTQPIMQNLVSVHLAGVCPRKAHIGEVVTPQCLYFYLSFFTFRPS